MDQLTPDQVTITANHYQEIITTAENIAPIEACGIIAGKDRKSTKVYPITNSLESPYEFLMEPAEMLQAFWDIEKQGWEVLAFFHSHPQFPPVPSRTDLARNYYPDTPHLILGKQQSNWKIRAYLMTKFEYKEIPITILSDGDI